MTISKPETKQLLERLIFEQERPQAWVEDVWGLSPTLGETAARLVEVLDALIESCPDDTLDSLYRHFLQASLQDFD